MGADESGRDKSIHWSADRDGYRAQTNAARILVDRGTNRNTAFPQDDEPESVPDVAPELPRSGQLESGYRRNNGKAKGSALQGPADPQCVREANDGVVRSGQGTGSGREHDGVQRPCRIPTVHQEQGAQVWHKVLHALRGEDVYDSSRDALLRQGRRDGRKRTRQSGGDVPNGRQAQQWPQSDHGQLLQLGGAGGTSASQRHPLDRNDAQQPRLLYRH